MHNVFTNEQHKNIYYNETENDNTKIVEELLGTSNRHSRGCAKELRSMSILLHVRHQVLSLDDNEKRENSATKIDRQLQRNDFVCLLFRIMDFVIKIN